MRMMDHIQRNWSGRRSFLHKPQYRRSGEMETSPEGISPIICVSKIGVDGIRILSTQQYHCPGNQRLHNVLRAVAGKDRIIMKSTGTVESPLNAAVNSQPQSANILKVKAKCPHVPVWVYPSYMESNWRINQDPLNPVLVG